MTRSMKGRLAKLEKYRKPSWPYVFYVSNPRTMAEEEAIANATGPIIIAPHPCKTVEEWLAKCSPMGKLQ